MYLKHVAHRKIFEFLNQINGNDDYIVAPYLSNYDTMVIKAKRSNIVFHVSDFDCVDVTNNVSYVKQWGAFMIRQMNNLGKELGNRYVNDLHDELEKATCVGPVR